VIHRLEPKSLPVHVWVWGRLSGKNLRVSLIVLPMEAGTALAPVHAGIKHFQRRKVPRNNLGPFPTGVASCFRNLVLKKLAVAPMPFDERGWWKDELAYRYTIPQLPAAERQPLLLPLQRPVHLPTLIVLAAMELFGKTGICGIFSRIFGGHAMPLTTRRWTEDDIAKLKNMAQRKPPADIAAALGRSVGALSVKAHQLKLSLKMPRGWTRRRAPVG